VVKALKNHPEIEKTTEIRKVNYWKKVPNVIHSRLFEDPAIVNFFEVWINYSGLLNDHCVRN